MATSLAMLLAIQVSGANLATLGSAILGVNDAIDGDALTRVDTWNGDSPDTVSYVGILWSRPIARAVTRVQLNLAIFSDGGWFGVNGVGPEGGTASNGFLGVFALVVEALPPTGVQPVVLVNPRSNGTRFEFGFNPQTGVTHVVRSKANVDDEWQVDRMVAGDGRYQTVTDTADERRRFYQVVSE